MSEADEKVRLYLNEHIRPKVQSDGGDIVVEDICDGNVVLRLRGQCVSCPAAHRHLVQWLGEHLKTEFGRPFTIEPVSDIPYFWR